MAFLHLQSHLTLTDTHQHTRTHTSISSYIGTCNHASVCILLSRDLSGYQNSYRHLQAYQHKQHRNNVYPLDARMRRHRGKLGRRSGSRPKNTARTSLGKKTRLFDGALRVRQHGLRCARSSRAQVLSPGMVGGQRSISGGQRAHHERISDQPIRTQRRHAAYGLLDPGTPRARDGVCWMEGVQRQIEGSEPMGWRTLGRSTREPRPCS